MIFLLDVDGVLIQPGGYRAALRATVNTLTREWGLGELAPDDDTVAIFEALGITCEWDMIPLLLGMVLEAVASVDATMSTDTPSPSNLLPVQRGGEEESVNEAVAGYFAHSQYKKIDDAGERLRVDFASAIRAVGALARAGEARGLAPANAVWEAFQAGEGPFGQVEAAVLRDLLVDTRWMARSRTTRLFETFAVGSRAFTEATVLPAEVETPALIAAHDQPLLAADVRARLLSLQARGRVCLAVYTARPSLPLMRSALALAQFVPEAEMALALLEMPDLALVGSGQTGEAALALGIHEDRLTKPSPYHALAALAAACLPERAEALAWMMAVYRWAEAGGPLPACPHLPDPLNFAIFEDSPAGMRGGLQAAEMLTRMGIPTRLRLYGVATHAEKAAALQALGARVYADVNQAITAALEESGLADD